MDLAKIRAYGAIVISILVTVILATLGVIAYSKNDQTNITMITGALVAQFAGVVQYWIGSSSGSQQKDETIMKSNPPPPPKDV